MKREKKEKIVAELKEKFESAKAIIFTDYRGLTVAELSELRRLLKDDRCEYKVVKNTLAEIASRGTVVSAAKESFKGPVGLAISYDDPVVIARKVLEYSKKNDKLKVTACIAEGVLYAPNDVKTLAELPPKRVLISMIAGALRAPLSKLATLFSATICRFVYALEALKQQRLKLESEKSIRT